MSQENDSNILNKLKKIYKQSFSKKYGADIVITKIIFLIFTIIFIHLFLKRNKEEIASNWKYNKCNPKYMLFSGWIKKSKDESAFEATVNNFSGCMTDLLKGMIDAAFLPVLDLTRIKIGEFKSNSKFNIDSKSSQIKELSLINSTSQEAACIAWMLINPYENLPQRLITSGHVHVKSDINDIGDININEQYYYIN